MELAYRAVCLAPGCGWTSGHNIGYKAREAAEFWIGGEEWHAFRNGKCYGPCLVVSCSQPFHATDCTPFHNIVH